MYIQKDKENGVILLWFKGVHRVSTEFVGNKRSWLSHYISEACWSIKLNILFSHFHAPKRLFVYLCCKAYMWLFNVAHRKQTQSEGFQTIKRFAFEFQWLSDLRIMHLKRGYLSFCHSETLMFNFIYLLSN